MKIGEIKKKDYEKLNTEIPLKDMDLGDSMDISLDGINNIEAEDYMVLIEKIVRKAEGPEERYGRRSPGFSVRLWPKRRTDGPCPLVHICRVAGGIERKTNRCQTKCINSFFIPAR